MNARYDPSLTTVLFLHNAKTAGRTLRDYLGRVYDPKVFFWPTNLYSVVRFTVQPPPNVRELRFVGGHFNYGLHEPHFPDHAYFALFREPVDRVASFYFYRKRSPQESDYRYLNENGVSLEDYVSSGRVKENDNGQVRRISGAGTGPPFGDCPAELLDRAKANIERDFAAVGLQERFPETLALLRRVFGWPEAPYADLNITPGRPARRDLPKDTVRLIERHNELDLELYRFAAERFNRLVGESRIGYNHAPEKGDPP